MTHQKDRFEELGRRLAARTRELQSREPARPRLHAVEATTTPSFGLDVVTRESHCRMIRHIRRRWGSPMQRLIDQACFGVTDIDRLGDGDLVQLHMDLERAEQCMLEGISFEDAGLFRQRYA